MIISFFVAGQAKPAGSKRGFALKQGGHFTGRVIVTDDCKESKNWKAQVRLFASEHLPEGFVMFEGPLRVNFTFYRERPAGHSGTKGLNKKGRETPHPTTKPDCDKLSRAVMDALTGVLWIDDAQVVTKLTKKRWGRPGVQIEVDPETESALKPLEELTQDELAALV